MDLKEILITQQDRTNFLKGLIRISKCDGRQDERELLFYQQSAIAMGITDSEKEELDRAWHGNERISLKFEGTEQKMFFFIQAIQLCWIDEHYADKERQEIRAIAEELKISEGAIMSVESWVHEGMEWNKKGEELLKLK